MFYLARASNAYCKSTLRLVMLMIYNTFSALYKESWQSMKREWRQGNILPRVRRELRELKKWIKFNNGIETETKLQMHFLQLDALLWHPNADKFERVLQCLFQNNIFIYCVNLLFTSETQKPFNGYWLTSFHSTSILDKIV